jgi:hypothetical protein
VTELREPAAAAPRDPVERPTPARRRLGAVFPGDIWVWRVAGAVVAVLGVILLVNLLAPRELFLGSNSVAARDYVAPVQPGETMCVRDVLVPAGTQRIRWGIDTQDKPRIPVDMQVRLHGGPVLRGSIVRSANTGYHLVDIPMTAPVPSDGAPYRVADICLQPKGAGGQIFVWGRTQLDIRSKPIEIGKQRIPNRVALWFLPLKHEQRSILGQLNTMFERASLFRPGFVGPWTFWLVLFLLVPGLLYGGIRLLATADLSRPRRIPIGAWVAILAFGAAASWAIVNPVFQAPDESEHFAYVQYFAETGHPIDLNQGKRAVWSDREALIIDASHELSVIERSQAKLPWLKEIQTEERSRAAHYNPPGGSATNGGGYHPATSVHTPLYYAALAPGYLLTKHSSTESQLLAMRLSTAIMGALTAMLAYLIVLELLPGRRALAAAGGLLVGFEPMFAFISGAVNNDSAVNLGCAAIIYLFIRAMRRGLTAPIAIALGLALVITPLLKGTGYELYPPAIIAVLGLVARRHGRRDLMMLGLVAASFLFFFFGWDAIRGIFHRDAFTTPGGATPGTSFGIRDHIKAYLVWLWQTLLPFKLPFMQDVSIIHWPFFNIYVQRGFAGFGWYAIFFPNWVYAPIVAGMIAVLVLGARALWIYRPAALARAPEILFLASVPVVVFCAVEAAYFTIVWPVDGTAEQGRYAFTAITALAAIVIGGCLGLGKRRALPAAAGLVAGLGMLLLAGQWLTLATFYT